jgi:hypothetical protein
MDANLQHNGWVKINAGIAAGNCRNILEEEEKSSWHYQ